MGRRSDHEPEELRELAIDAAEELVKRGEKPTARAVAKEIGYAPGTLYNLFADRDELLLCVNGRTLDRLLEVIEPAKSPVELGEAYLRFARGNRKAWELLFDSRFPAGSRPRWYREKVGALFGIVERIVGKKKAHVHWAAVHGIVTLSLGNHLAAAGAPKASELIRNLFA